ncbi:hypothetical protein BASA83_006140, partial [Batrachochytrium salamandrivorans]
MTQTQTFHQLTSQFLVDQQIQSLTLESATLTTSHSIQSPAPIWVIPLTLPIFAKANTCIGKHSLPLQPYQLLTQSSATLFEMSGLDSRLLPPNSREWMVANNGSSTLTIFDRAVSDGRTDLVFSAARAMSGNSSRSAAVTPLYNSDGIVQYDPTSILRVMQGHYGFTGSRHHRSLDWNLQYWHDRQPIQVPLQYTTIRNSDILDQDFSWNQIAAALLQMSPRKAPGDDGITTAFYQAALYMPADTQEDGDPLNPGDKRGIALINVGLKLVCKVLQMRIERFVETNNLLSYEQAGFRKREECVGQVVSLVDIIQRRQNAGLNTHVLFIDIRKAFDTVPVGALLWKLQNMGFPRRTLAFLKALYTSSSARARGRITTIGPISQYREVSDRDVHCLDLLFILFINDILDGVAPITVPGLPRDTNPIRGLMYADDVAVFADSEQSLLAASTAIEQWANRWEMQFGVAKCGIISFTGHLAPRLDNHWIFDSMDSCMAQAETVCTSSTPSRHLHPVLANHQLNGELPISHILCSGHGSKPIMGLELVGGNKSHLAPLQTTINKGIRLFTGARLSTAIGPLLVETGIGSLLTRSLYHEAVGKIPALVLVSSDQTAIQEQILADTTSQTKDSQATTLVCIDGDSANMWRLCIAPKLLSTSIAHLVVECEQVTGHRIQSGLVPAIQKSRLRLLGRALDPGVENVYTWLRGGVLNGEADLDQRWLT